MYTHSALLGLFQTSLDMSWLIISLMKYKFRCVSAEDKMCPTVLRFLGRLERSFWPIWNNKEETFPASVDIEYAALFTLSAQVDVICRAESLISASRIREWHLSSVMMNVLTHVTSHYLGSSYRLICQHNRANLSRHIGLDGPGLHLLGFNDCRAR